LVGGNGLLKARQKTKRGGLSKPPRLTAFAAIHRTVKCVRSRPGGGVRRGRGGRERWRSTGTPCRTLSLQVQCWGLGGGRKCTHYRCRELCGSTVRATSDTLRPTEVPLLWRCGLLQTAHCFAPCAGLRGPQSSFHTSYLFGGSHPRIVAVGHVGVLGGRWSCGVATSTRLCCRLWASTRF
jgi:hypothetical protein